MAKVTLIDYTGKGRPDQAWHAANMLIFTKRTRLEMTPDAFSEVQELPVEAKREELDYMAATIRSSWEFVDLTFLISDVSRAVAQQITRTRTASYAMQSQRVTDVSAAGVVQIDAKDVRVQELYEQATEGAFGKYGEMLRAGATPEQARGVLPINTCCNLVAKYNLRTLADVVETRKSIRAQGEYADIALQMESLAEGVWPWVAPFFRPKNETAAQLIEEVARSISEGNAISSKQVAMKLAKAADLIKKG